MPRRKRGEWNKPIHGNLLASLMDGVRTLDPSPYFALFFEQTVSDINTRPVNGVIGLQIIDL